MNNLSWFFLLVDWLEGAKTFFQWFGVFAVLATGGWIIRWMVAYEDRDKDTKTYCVWWMKASVFLSLLCFVLVTITPSKDTLYLILASEVGEEAVTSEVGAEVLDEAKGALLHQLKRLQGELR